MVSLEQVDFQDSVEELLLLLMEEPKDKGLLPVLEDWVEAVEEVLLEEILEDLEEQVQL